MRHSQTRLMTAAMVAAVAMASHDQFFNPETKHQDVPPANSFAKTKKNQRRKKKGRSK